MVGERHDAIPPLKGARGIYLNPKNPPNPLVKGESPKLNFKQILLI